MLFLFVTIPLPDDTMSIITDASGSGIGGVLQVKRKGEWEAATLFSRQTRGPERRYSAMDLEALALVKTVRHLVTICMVNNLWHLRTTNLFVLFLTLIN